MSSVTVEGILIGVGITLLGVVVGGYLGYHFSRKVAEEQLKKMAGAKLRGAFAPQMALYTLMGQEAELGPRLKQSLHAHATAVEEYKVFISSKNQTGYQEAWNCYYNSTATKGDCGPFDDSKIYIERINAILKFTKD